MCIGSVSQVLNGGEGTVGLYRFPESGVKWWCGDSLVCIGFVTQVIIGGEGTVGCVSVQ